MNKNIVLCCSIMLIICMTISGCIIKANHAENDSDTQEITTGIISETVTTSENESAVIKQQQAISFQDLPDDIKGTIIPVDSLMLYHVETGKEYDPHDSYMFWRTLQFALGNFGVNYNRAEITEYELAVESMVIGEFATSFICDYDKLEPIPEELSDSIRYDSAEDIYYFGLGDRGLSQTEILSYEYVDNNTLKLSARLYALDDDSTICKGNFVLTRNEYASGVIEPLFYFTVTEAVFE